MHRHFKLYKPYGYLSQFISNQKPGKRKKLLGELHSFPEKTMSIGRLDKDSEGLLLLTSNGKLSAKIGRSGIEKEYYVQVDGLIDENAIEKLKEGVKISIQGIKYTTKPCKAFLLETAPDFPARAKPIRDERHGPVSWASITLTEGKFRQVKKMTAAVGFPTLRLIRIRIGNEYLEKLESGQAIEVEKYDI